MPRGIAAALVVALLWAGWRASAFQVPLEPCPERKAKQAADQPKLQRVYFGNKNACGGTSCHERLEPLGSDDKDATAAFARLHEMNVWFKLDKHKDATKVLTEGVGKKIAQRMGIPVEPVDFVKNKSHWKQCLTCHGVYVEDEKEVDKKSFSPQQRVESGVSCVACHGAHAEWVFEHTKPVNNVWQTFTRQEKQVKFGLRDLWDPSARATLCCSCHVGNAAEGKIVTHEMYAAGHPPLPGFEIATFSEAMPRHWETWSEKLKRLSMHKDLYAKAYQFDPGQEQIEAARMLVISAAVAFRETMHLSASQAAQTAKADKAEAAAWPELAAFDCYACHHDLKRDSWRQERGYKGKPGRPQMRDWPLALLHVSIDHAGQDGAKAAITANRQQFDKHLQDLIEVFNDQPFGSPPRVAKAACSLVAWSDNLITQLEQAKYDRAAAQRLLRSLNDYAQKGLLDFDSARQIAWASQALYTALDGAKARSQFDALNAQLNLQLPIGQQAIAGPFMSRTMKLVQDYDPKVFQKNMEKIAAAP
jgi:hypothetical protein